MASFVYPFLQNLSYATRFQSHVGIRVYDSWLWQPLLCQLLHVGLGYPVVFLAASAQHLSP